MKTKWQFKFRSWGITFPKEHRFVGAIGANDEQSVSKEFEFRIIPKSNQKVGDADDAGEFHLTLPGEPDETEQLAHLIVGRVKEQIAFPDSRVEIFGGFITAEKMPDTSQEAEQIGDQRHWIRLSMIEYRPPTIFDPSRLTDLEIPKNFGVLLQLFNEAKKIEKPVEKFLAFFKILENAYADGRGTRLSQSLVGNDQLFNTFATLIKPAPPGHTSFDRKEFRSLIHKLIRIRDNCAHLRGKTGYLPNDVRIRNEVEPHLGLLIVIAEKIIQDGLQWKSPPVK